MSVVNIVEEIYECHCMECGDIIKRKDGETEKEQEEWFIMDDELKLCSKCVQSTDEEVRAFCSSCGWEGKCCVSENRAKELKEQDLMEENCFNNDCEKCL